MVMSRFSVPLWGRDEVERSAKRDERLALKTRLKLRDESGEVGHDPGVQVGVVDWLTFLGVGQQVDDARVGVWRCRVEELALLDEDRLEVLPLDSVELVAVPEQESLPVRPVLLAAEERA